MLSRALLSATAIIGLTATLVNAEQRYNPTDVTPKCQTLYVSQKATNGQVCLSINNDNLIIKYLAVTGYSYSEVHVWIGVSVPPTTAPGQFPFTSGNGNCTVTNDKKSATCTIPLSKLDGDLCDEELSITTHAALDGQTGWAGNKCINDNCHPWAKYFTFNFICSFAMTTSSSATLSTGGGPASTKTTSIISSEGISLTSLTELPPIITTTETITTTTITCPVSRRCYLVTCFSTRTAVLTRTVTVPCETSIYVSSDHIIVTTITKPAITAYVTCPAAHATTVHAMTVSAVAAPKNTTVPKAPVPSASPFQGGSPALGISLGGIMALVALFGGLLL